MMFLAATSTPNPTPSGVPDPDLVTPGTIGFVTTFFIVIVTIFLIRDALKRARRVRARAHTSASDAYPIPLRKYAVPNQSRLSGAEAPEALDETGDVSAEGPAGSEGTSEDAAGDSADSGASDPSSDERPQ